MLIRLSHKITRDSIVDGPGLRAVIWTQGCKHNCMGCHNPCTHSFNGGFLMDSEDIIKELKDLRLHKGGFIIDIEGDMVRLVNGRSVWGVDMKKIRIFTKLNKDQKLKLIIIDTFEE